MYAQVTHDKPYHDESIWQDSETILASDHVSWLHIKVFLSIAILFHKDTYKSYQSEKDILQV